MKVGPLLTESGPTILARTPKKAQVGLLFEEVGPLLAECDPTFPGKAPPRCLSPAPLPLMAPCRCHQKEERSEQSYCTGIAQTDAIRPIPYPDTVVS